MSPETTTRQPARVLLVGVRGFGAVHARNIAALTERGLVRLVAAVDPAGPPEDALPDGVPLFDDLSEALAAVGGADVVIIAAPIGEHFRLAATALTADADVLLEKPPVASFDDFERLLAAERATGRVVQIGFQSLGSTALDLLRSDAYGLGPITRVGAVGAWSRTHGYWTRSAWAGRRSLDGRPVVDGVVTNPLAHAVATSLAVVGCRGAEDVVSVDVDLYRANAIDGDDTSVVRIATAAGPTVTCALSLCCPDQAEPRITIVGERGQASLAYTSDRLTVTVGDRTDEVTAERTDLLTNLLAHRADGVPLLVPLASTGAFMRVLAAVADAGEPTRIDPRAITWTGEGSDRRPIVDDIEHWLDEATAREQTFAELGVPWAHAGKDSVAAEASVGRLRVASYRDGAGTIPTSSPRPYLHPVRTLGGVVVTARTPADHDWHLGGGLAVPDVNGSSFWGGGTYVHGEGYVLLDNHGRIDGDPPALADDGFRQSLRWVGHDGSILLTEQREVEWSESGIGWDAGWRLGWESTLRAEVDAVLASPGSKGRVDGGYGGFFWRMPRCQDVAVFTQTANGEAAVQGRVAPWLAWSADFDAGPELGGPATLVFLAADAAEAGEPWFVRVESYPGVGSALAWQHPLSLAAGQTWHRRFSVLVIDGRYDAAQVAELVRTLA